MLRNRMGCGGGDFTGAGQDASRTSVPLSANQIQAAGVWRCSPGRWCHSYTFLPGSFDKETPGPGRQLGSGLRHLSRTAASGRGEGDEACEGDEGDEDEGSEGNEGDEEGEGDESNEDEGSEGNDGDEGSKEGEGDEGSEGDEDEGSKDGDEDEGDEGSKEGDEDEGDAQCSLMLRYWT